MTNIKTTITPYGNRFVPSGVECSLNQSELKISTFPFFSFFDNSPLHIAECFSQTNPSLWYPRSPYRLVVNPPLILPLISLSELAEDSKAIHRAGNRRHYQLSHKSRIILSDCTYAFMQKIFDIQFIRHTVYGGFNTHLHAHTDLHNHTHMQTLSVRMDLWVNWPSAISGWQAEQRLRGHCLLAVRTK